MQFLPEGEAGLAVATKQPPGGGSHGDDAKENDASFHAAILAAFPDFRGGKPGNVAGKGLAPWLIDWNAVDRAGQLGQRGVDRVGM